jgi:hypothetical protein
MRPSRAGDLPEAPGGSAALSRVAMAWGNHFPPPPERAALHREAKWPPRAILRSAPAPWVQSRSAPGKRLAVKAAIGAA